MKQQIPSSVRDALAKQAAGDVHPPADLLTGFMEHGLSADENARINSHLAACKDCREIVFLASAAAAGEPVAAPVQTYVPVTSWWRTWMSWKWLAPALVAVVVVTGVVIEHQLNAPHPAANRTVAEARPAALPPSQAGSAAPEGAVSPAVAPSAGSPDRGKPQAKKYTRANTDARQSLTLQSPPKAADHRFSAALTSSAPAPPLTIAKSGSSAALPQAKSLPLASPASESTAPPVDTHAQQSADMARAEPQPLAPSNAVAHGSQPGSMMAGSFAVKTRPAAAQWRISADGHVERSMASGVWTSVLSDQTVTFRSVAVIGSDVWAGGNNGALFHSSDGGNQWSQVTLASNGETERGTVNVIRFDTSSDGRVTTEDGTSWTTSDGGKTWSKQ